MAPHGRHEPSVWVDNADGSRSQVWPPPSGGASSGASRDAARGLSLIARAARTAREEAEAAEAARQRRQREAYQREAYSREVYQDRSRSRAWEPPPLERGAWRRWTERVRCAQRAALSGRATQNAPKCPQACFPLTPPRRAVSPASQSVAHTASRVWVWRRCAALRTRLEV
jgi:hypothetical protein